MDLDDARLFTPGRASEPLAPDEAMTRLGAKYPGAGRVVEVQFFAGMTPAEAADILGVSSKTVQRDWKLARALLRAELAGTPA